MIGKFLKGQTIRDVSYYAIAQIYAKVAQFILISVLVKYLLPEEYGIYGLVFVSYKLFPIVCTGGLSRGVGRLSIEERFSPNRISSLFTFVFSIQFCLIAILLILSVFIPYFGTILAGNFFYLIGLVVLGSLSEMLMSIFEINRKAASIALARSIAITLQVLFLIIAFSFFKNGLTIAFISLYVLEIVVIIIYIYRFPGKRLKPNFNFVKLDLIHSFKFSIPLIIYSGSIWLYQFVDRFVIEVYLDLKQLAYYTLAFQLANTVVWVSEPVNQALAPKYDNGYEKRGLNKLINVHNHHLSIYLCLTVVAVIASSIFSFLYISFYAPSEYSESLKYVFIIILGGAFKILYLPFANAIRAIKATTLSAKYSVFALLTNLILNLIFIPLYGLAGAAWTTSFSYLMLLINYFYASYKVGVKTYFRSFYKFEWVRLGKTE